MGVLAILSLNYDLSETEQRSKKKNRENFRKVSSYNQLLTHLSCKKVLLINKICQPNNLKYHKMPFMLKQVVQQGFFTIHG